MQSKMQGKIHSSAVRSPMADPPRRCIVSVDQGTSSTKAIVIDEEGQLRARAHHPISQSHPEPGHVEQDATEIASSVMSVLDDVAAQIAGDLHAVAVGISSQRESAVMWERSTGQPLGPMLGWQDRRTSAAADRLRQAGEAAEVRRRSGLPLDPMFSALKIAWLLDSVDIDRRRSAAGEIAVGTVDSWLVSCLTGEHRIEAGNASRTQLMNIADTDWDEHLLALFGVPSAALPVIARSDKPTAPILNGRLAGTPIFGVLGDSHAALYAHGARTPGDIKATYGTGSSIMGLVDDVAGLDEGVVATIAWQTDTTSYAGEGNILSTGATLVWLASILDIDIDGLMELAESADQSQPLDLVPAFAGLGAPWWDDAAVATLAGFDLGAARSDLALAAADSVVLQVEDVIAVFDESGQRASRILVDGGPTSNDWLMQRQADLSQRAVVRRAETGLSALGAAHLAGAAAGLFDSDQPLAATGASTTFESLLDLNSANRRRQRWRGAIDRSRCEVVTGADSPVL